MKTTRRTPKPNAPNTLAWTRPLGTPAPKPTKAPKSTKAPKFNPWTAPLGQAKR